MHVLFDISVSIAACPLEYSTILLAHISYFANIGVNGETSFGFR
jgi:hypothetical protein